MAQVICANASVSMVSDTPDRRTQNQPYTSAPAAATSGPSSSAVPMGQSSQRTSSAAP